jgi:ABC-type uncharacterized transport system substrate-binding protein
MLLSRHTRRREFITLVDGAAVAWPLAARAQQKLPTIGYLGTAAAAAWAPWTAAFVQRLHELGWTDGRTVTIQYRWAEGRADRSAELAAELARLKVDVIVTGGNAALAAKQASSAVPIVFALVDDPVGMGLVASLARPGGNVTGLAMQTTDLVGKRLSLLREVIPNLRRLAIMANVEYPFAALEMAEAQTAAGTLGLDHPNQRLGLHRATADDSRRPRVRRSGRSDVVWTKPPGSVPARGRLCGQDSARCEAGRHTGRTADEIRACHQPQNRQGARP